MEYSLNLSLLLVYLASLCYVIASYYHLVLNEKWTFSLSISIALPIVIIEYCFSLPGNYSLNKYHNFDPIHILIITIIFYFINLWLLNVFIIKNPVKNYYNEIIAIILILSAFYITTVF